MDQSALLELQDPMRAGGGLDVMREALSLVLQALIDAEAVGDQQKCTVLITKSAQG